MLALRQSGVTLVELMISLALLALILFGAVPALISYLQDMKIQRVASDIRSGLQQTLTEAIRLNELVEFNLNGTGWNITVSDTDTVLANRPATTAEANISASSAATTIGFTGQGRTSPFSDYTILISSPSSGTCASEGGEIRCLRVNVSNSGQIKMCDTALASADPRAC